jgi:hypothetical protein
MTAADAAPLPSSSTSTTATSSMAGGVAKPATTGWGGKPTFANVSHPVTHDNEVCCCIHASDDYRYLIHP